MRWSRTLIPTLREDPADAKTASHKLMIRAGLIRKLTAGVYTYLPLGLIALNKSANIVRQEMNRAGAQEILMPVLQPAELWQETGRLDAFSDLLCKFKDRNGNINVLGPTHEEVVTDIVRNHITSYQQLPITLYQIQTKFRDEIRPRFGVIRSREFTMKDAYSFDTTLEGLDKSYKAMYDAYCRIFSRAGLNYAPVEADTGLIGGDVSHEFMIPCPSGEDVLVKCKKCGYSANKDKAECSAASGERQAEKKLEEVKTPGCATIEEVSKFLKVEPKDLVKTLIYKAPGKDCIAVLVRGDHEVNPAKLARVTGIADLELAGPEIIKSATGGPLGFSGPVGLKIKKFADYGIKNMANFVTGANKLDTHLLNVNIGRDFGTDTFADVRMISPDDPCPKCGAALEFSNCIEVGHVFKLGTKYSEKMKAYFQDENGASHAMIMGCYGIGVNRIMAAALESHHDESGIVWPKELAPYHVLLVSVNPKDARISQISENVYNVLKDAGLEILWDDRDVTAGIKFKDADLIGIPIRITVGSKTLQNNTVDIKRRNSKEQVVVNIDKVTEAVKDELKKYNI